MLSNVAEFEDVSELPGLLRQELANRTDWTPNCRKRLKIGRSNLDERDDMITTVVVNGQRSNQPTKYFHLAVENLHISKMALGARRM
jgi:hypothetical protein